MSCNRENVLWQSKDGTWNRAFYSFYDIEPEDPDEEWDYEWDVEYGDDFDWLSLGHASKDAAINAWDGSNPGGWDECAYADHPAECDRYDVKAAEALAAGVRNDRGLSGGVKLYGYRP
jgi:hypothetical protein